MDMHRIFFATNRNHIPDENYDGPDDPRWHPKGYGGEFSANGRHNLRFGQISVPFDERKVRSFIFGSGESKLGNGEGLAEYLSELVPDGTIVAEKEEPPENRLVAQAPDKLASRKVFREIKTLMEGRPPCDVLIYIHGFNVKWEVAVGSALALQLMLNRDNQARGKKDIIVVLFSWPSDKAVMPWASYYSDRDDGEASGLAVGRGILKLHQYLIGLIPPQQAEKEMEQLMAGDSPPEVMCQQDIHLLCHSMGNYVLQNAMPVMLRETSGHRLPRPFKHILLCAPDVDDDVFEKGEPLAQLPQMAHDVSIYYNRHDLAMAASENTKGNDDRLGQTGVSNETGIHRKIHQVDCTDIAKQGLVKHSYYLWDQINQDIRQTLDDIEFESPERGRTEKGRNSSILVRTEMRVPR